MKPIITAVLLSLATPPGFAAGTHGGGHGDAMEVGTPATAEDATTQIAVSLFETDDGDMLIEPGELDFAAGETVLFTITNNGDYEHEFVMDTIQNNEKHKELMEQFPEMEHADPNALRLQPGETGTFAWTFANAGTFEFACLIPGHYQSGMHGALSVN
jgi:uncharacterized cupredoxin-like copper-binding protein